MKNNQETIAHLTEFIGSDRAEIHYGAWCDRCGERFVTVAARQKAGEAKQLAAQIIMALNQPDAASDTWAQLVKDTVFDNFNAAICRGEYPSESRPYEGKAWSHWITERASFMNGIHVVAQFPFGEPSYPTPITPEQIEEGKKRYQEAGRAHHAECPSKPIAA